MVRGGWEDADNVLASKIRDNGLLVRSSNQHVKEVIVYLAEDIFAKFIMTVIVKYKSGLSSRLKLDNCSS